MRCPREFTNLPAGAAAPSSILSELVSTSRAYGAACRHPGKKRDQNEAASEEKVMLGKLEDEGWIRGGEKKGRTEGAAGHSAEAPTPQPALLGVGA